MRLETYLKCFLKFRVFLNRKLTSYVDHAVNLKENPFLGLCNCTSSSEIGGMAMQQMTYKFMKFKG